jgi:hypothetical protein
MQAGVCPLISKRLFISPILQGTPNSLIKIIRKAMSGWSGCTLMNDIKMS